MAEASWSEKAYAAVWRVARTSLEFTPDDVWDTGLEKPSDARALGAVMKKLKKDKIIEKTGRSQATRQRQSHGTDVTVWRSLVFVQVL